MYGNSPCLARRDGPDRGTIPHIQPGGESSSMTSRGSVFHSLAPLLCLTAFLLTPSPADPAERSTFFESVDVHVVNVEVYVADRDGKRVPGLSREDFELFEDGKPVKISNFYASDAATAATAAASPTPSAPA